MSRPRGLASAHRLRLRSRLLADVGEGGACLRDEECGRGPCAASCCCAGCGSTDGGQVTGPTLSLRVGCGCGAGGPSSLGVLAAAAAAALRRRGASRRSAALAAAVVS